MAKILPCYSLCPLIEQNSFLGVTNDVENDIVIVTANSNIIGRFKVPDSKEITSWNSKGSITSAAIYDSDKGCYIAIFNYNELRMWTLADENIDKIKKYKFSEKLHGLLISPESGKCIVIFQNGNTLYLDDAVEQRKNTFENSVLNCEENIVTFEVILISDLLVVVLLISGLNNLYRLVGIPLKESRRTVFDINLNSTYGSNFLNHCLLVNKNCYFISLWSDGKLYQDSLFPIVENIPKYCLTTIDDMELDKSVIMKVLSPDYIAICGKKNDGIMLIIFSIKYNLVQCKQFYENCTNPRKLWNFESKLFLIIGYNLVVIPYVLENRKLSTLIGSNLCQFDHNKIDFLPETNVYKNVLLNLMENEDVNGILDIVNSYCDIPDSILIHTLQWCLQNKKLRKNIMDVILHHYSVNDASSLRTTVTVNLSLELLDYVIKNITQSNNNLKLIKWASLLIDTFYLQYIMSNDKVIFESLKLYLMVLKKEYDCLNDYRELIKYLFQFVK